MNTSQPELTSGVNRGATDEIVPVPRLVRAGLAYMALGGVLVGAWALFAPDSFYRDFPGFGRQWVAVDGPYNEHLLRDVGSLNLALALITAVAAVRLGPTMIRAVCAGWLVYSVPHLAYHAAHRSGLTSTDFVAEILSLSMNLIVPACLLVTLALAQPRRR